jgi:hypothetical protein
MYIYDQNISDSPLTEGPAVERARRGLLVAHGFPPQYALSTQDSELANARCELSKARWEFMIAMRTGRVPGRLLRR